MTSGQPPCIAARADNACATVVPLMDVTDHVAGLVVATGGAERDVVWVPLDWAPALWTSVVSRLRQAGDSVLGSRRDASTSRGHLRSVLVGDRLAFVQPLYAWRTDGPKTMLGVTALVGDSILAGASLAEAIGADTLTPSPVAPVASSADAAAFRARVTALYDTMQSALKRGDLSTFGTAYAELGRAPRPPGGAAADREEQVTRNRRWTLDAGRWTFGIVQPSSGPDDRCASTRRSAYVNIHEYQAKELLRQAGIPVQPGEVAATPAEAEAIARRADGRGRDQSAGARRRTGEGGRCQARQDAGRSPGRRRAHSRHVDQGSRRAARARRAGRRHRGRVVRRHHRRSSFEATSGDGEPRGRHRHRGGGGDDA